MLIKVIIFTIVFIKIFVNLLNEVEYILLIFQVVTFFLEMFFWILFATSFIFSPKVYFDTESSKETYSSYSILNSHKKNKLADILVRVLGGIIAILIMTYCALPYILDLPKLVTRNFNYVTGYVDDVRTEKKDINEYVYVEGKKIKFFFSANIEKYNTYKIAYLPHTSRAIYGVKLEGNTLKVEKKIGFPFKQLFFFIFGLSVLVLLAFLSPYLRFKLLILACIIYYPTNLYLYINYGISSGIWFSLSNQGLSSILIGVAILLVLGVCYFIERLKDYDTPVTLFIIQVFSILKILILFGEELHLL